MFDNIKGIGPKKAEALHRLGVKDERGLLLLLPNRYEDKRKVYSLERSPKDRGVVTRLKIIKKNKAFYSKGKIITKIYAEDNDQCEILYFNDKYTPKAIEPGKEYYLYGKITYKNNKYYLYNPEYSDIEDDFLRLSPIYPLTKGLYQKELNNFISQALDNFAVDDFLLESDIGHYDLYESFRKVHQPNTYKEIASGLSELAYRRILLNILSLNYIRSINKKKNKIHVNYNKVKAFVESLAFTLTSDQEKAIKICLYDLSKKEDNMTRLIQGDVGSGKTVVAIACGVGIIDESQVAFIAPTEVLASQHYNNYKSLLETLGISSVLLTGSIKNSEKNSIKENIKRGNIDFVFGTHALLEDDVIFKSLALVITDEQHKFGVRQRNKLVEKCKYPNTLLMSATPIPRSLALARYGDLDITNIKSKPKGRKEIQTFALNIDYESRIFTFIEEEINKGKQAYIVCPSINDDRENNLESVEGLKKRFALAKPEIKLGILHGEMTSKDKEKVMEDFYKNKIQVLISTTVIEVGVDARNASVMLIYNAERFGLAQLHQLRGRVGRGSDQSYCILICTSNSTSARRRMKIISEESDGFIIAEKDLEMRGPGEIIGNLQHGIIEKEYFNYVKKEDIVKAYEDSNLILKDDPYLKKSKNKYLLHEVNRIIDNTSGYSLN